MGKKISQNKVGRPKLTEDDVTLHVGFCVPAKLWEWFTKFSDSREQSYSSTFREVLERMQREQEG